MGHFTSKNGPSDKRHANRTRCSYCGFRFAPTPPYKRKDKMPFARTLLMKTWDHVFPASMGGKIQVPCCGMCNAKKADSRVRDFLESVWLHQRRQYVQGADPQAPVSVIPDKVLHNLEREDYLRIWRNR